MTDLYNAYGVTLLAIVGPRVRCATLGYDVQRLRRNDVQRLRRTHCRDAGTAQACSGLRVYASTAFLLGGTSVLALPITKRPTMVRKVPKRRKTVPRS